MFGMHVCLLLTGLALPIPGPYMPAHHCPSRAGHPRNPHTHVLFPVTQAPSPQPQVSHHRNPQSSHVFSHHQRSHPSQNPQETTAKPTTPQHRPLTPSQRTNPPRTESPRATPRCTHPSPNLVSRHPHSHFPRGIPEALPFPAQRRIMTLIDHATRGIPS